MAGIKAGSAVKYISLPGIVPRVRELFFNGFGLLAYYVALICGMAKIIPALHPCLNQENIGRFGLFQVVRIAWRHLDLSWRNIDRILLFFALVSGLALSLLYVAGSFFLLITAPSMSASIGSLFGNPYPHDDIAFMMMDRVLGIPGVFNSKVITDQAFGPVPNPFQFGLQSLFAYFSWTMFGFAVLILLYFVVEIILETTATGSAFGKHFENIWTPVRIVAGLGLLIPFAYGLNSAQWITLYVAKMGSNMATNAWLAYNNGMDNPLGMSNQELVALPVTPDFTGLAKDLFTIRACVDVDQKLASGKGKKTTVESDGTIVVTGSYKHRVEPFFVDRGRYFAVLGMPGQPNNKLWPAGYNNNFINLYLEGLRFYKGQDVRIIFGRFNEENLADNTYPGGVEPVCGEVVIPNLLPAGRAIPAGNVQNADINEGLLIGASHMYAVLKMIYSVTKTGLEDNGTQEEQYNYQLMKAATDRFYYQGTAAGQERLKEHRAKVEAGEDDGNPDCMNDSDNDGIDDFGSDKFEELGACTGPVSEKFFANLVQTYQRYFSYGSTMGFDFYTGQGQQKLNQRCAAIDCSKVVSGAVATCQRASASCAKTRDGYAAYKPLPSVYYEDLGQANPFLVNHTVGSDLFKYGWGGAGIWYNFLSQKNGALTGATNSLPHVTHFSRLMEIVGAARATTDNNVSQGGCERFNPAKSGDKPVSVPGNINEPHEMALMYYNLCSRVQLNENLAAPGTTAQKTGNPILDVINAIFGTKTLYSFKENSSVNPMSALATLGRALLDRSIYSIALGAGGSAVGGLFSLFGSALGGQPVGQMALASGEIVSALSKLTVSFAMTGLVAGILLYYVLPFLPFMYFFFAVGAWVKTVFEALVGVPLWAMAHIRLDGGPGFSGQAASGGYFLLLEIFIRPILTLFALIASLFIFMALASMMNAVWGIVTANLVGFDPMMQASSDPLSTAFYRPRLDQFFFTIMYIVFMYMLATGSFKLIDMIPDNIMRWIKEVKTTGQQDNAEDLVGQVSQIVSYPIYYQGAPIIEKGVDLIGKVPKDLGGIVGEFGQMAAKFAPPASGAGGGPAGGAAGETGGAPPAGGNH